MTKETVETRKINDNLEIDLFLENGIYFLLLKDLSDNPIELEPIQINSNQETAKHMLNEAEKLSQLNIHLAILRQIITGKVLKELYGLPGTVVFHLDELFN